MNLSYKGLFDEKVHLDGLSHPDFRAVENTLREQLKKYLDGT
jgi:hypothetical protein